MAGNGPINTSPLFASDETLVGRLRGDFWSMATGADTLAAGTDGTFAADSQWTMTSPSVNFEAQGLQPQQVMLLTKGTINSGGQAFTGGGRWFALDSVAGNSVTLRMVNQQLGVGHPPVSTAGATAVNFLCATYQTLIEDASWDIKSRFGIDEAIYWRSSMWQYQGVEDAYRDERAACVLQVMFKAFSIENRSEKGDYFQKIARFKREYDETLERLQIRWGPLGDSEEPTTLFSAKLAR